MINRKSGWSGDSKRFDRIFEQIFERIMTHYVFRFYVLQTLTVSTSTMLK